jgi:hypothetical protein
VIGRSNRKPRGTPRWTGHWLFSQLHFTQAGIGYAEVSVTLDMGRPYTSYAFERAEDAYEVSVTLDMGRPYTSYTFERAEDA